MHYNSLPPLLFHSEFENKNISYLSFYQSQRDGVFHNQVLRCASGTPCPQGLRGERGEYQVLGTLSCYYRRTVMAPLRPLLPPPPPPDPARQEDGTVTAACSAHLYIFAADFIHFLLASVKWRPAKAQNMEDTFCGGNLRAERHETKMERVISFFFLFFLGRGSVELQCTEQQALQTWTWSTLYPSEIKMHAGPASVLRR